MSNSPTLEDRSGATPAGSGDKAAVIATLSRRFRAPLVRFFEKRIGRQADVEDLVQEVFLRLTAGGKIESLPEPEGYLFRTAANVLNDRQRRLAARAAENHETYDEAVHGSARETLTPEHALFGTQAIEQLVAALHELPQRTRDVWVLYHLHNLTHADLARRLHVTVSSIEKHMARATSYLLERLELPK